MSLFTSIWCVNSFSNYCSLVGLYSIDTDGALFLFYGLKSGVSHLMFSPCGNYLFSGERKVSCIKDIHVRTCNKQINLIWLHRLCRVYYRILARKGFHSNGCVIPLSEVKEKFLVWNVW